jgi:hypothetical protein
MQAAAHRHRIGQRVNRAQDQERSQRLRVQCQSAAACPESDLHLMSFLFPLQDARSANDEVIRWSEDHLDVWHGEELLSHPVARGAVLDGPAVTVGVQRLPGQGRERQCLRQIGPVQRNDRPVGLKRARRVASAGYEVGTGCRIGKVKLAQRSPCGVGQFGRPWPSFARGDRDRDIGIALPVALESDAAGHHCAVRAEHRLAPWPAKA